MFNINRIAKHWPKFDPYKLQHIHDLWFLCETIVGSYKLNQRCMQTKAHLLNYFLKIVFHYTHWKKQSTNTYYIFTKHTIQHTSNLERFSRIWSTWRSNSLLAGSKATGGRLKNQKEFADIHQGGPIGSTTTASNRFLLELQTFSLNSGTHPLSSLGDVLCALIDDSRFVFTYRESLKTNHSNDILV